MGKKLKFLTNNFIDPNILAAFTYSSQNASYPASNLNDPFRSKVWRSNGYFLVNWDNYQLTINDGSNKIAEITKQVYTTAALLATELQFQLNSVSSGFTVTYSSISNRFTISRTSTFSILWTISTGAANLFGYNDLVDDIGLSTYVADSRRICYPFEWLQFDFGISRNPKGLVLLDNLEENIKIQPSITVKLQASPSDSWNSPEEVTLTYNPQNITKIDMDGLFTTGYRYSRLVIPDLDNPLGYVQLGKVYLGDVYELESSDVQREFEESFIDLSTIQRAIGGELYSDNRATYANYGEISIQYCNKNDVDAIMEIYQIHRTYTPFIISIDSESTTTNNINEWTKYVRFTSPPRRQTVTNQLWNVRISLEEVL